MRSLPKPNALSPSWRKSAIAIACVALAMAGRSFAAIAPEPTDRAALVGQTGSGKTTLAEMLCRVRPYVVVFDPKGRISWPGYERHTTLRSLANTRASRLIYAPVYEELYDESGAAQDKAFEFIFRRQNTTLYVDEIYAYAKGDVFPFHYGACVTRGREIGVEVYTSTQRPAYVPGIMFSEAEHLYVFKLRKVRDRQRIEAESGIDGDAIFALPKWDFYYARQDSEPEGPLTLALPGAGMRATA